MDLVLTDQDRAAADKLSGLLNIPDPTAVIRSSVKTLTLIAVERKRGGTIMVRKPDRALHEVLFQRTGQS